MNPIVKILPILLSIAIFLHVTSDAVDSEEDFVNDQVALQQCVNKTDEYHHTYLQAEYRNHNCSLACEYIASVTYVTGSCGRGSSSLGCIVGSKTEKRMDFFSVNDGESCKDSVNDNLRKVCHEGICVNASSDNGNMTVTKF